MYNWFNQTVYYFHVPLLFICSGYLHKKLPRIDSGSDWFKNVLRKLLNLGDPYVAFTIAACLVKLVFSGAGSNEMDGLLETLFLQPTASYWYLYCLFFIFLIIGIFKNKRQAIFGTVAVLVMKIISIFGIGGDGYAICSINHPHKRNMVRFRNANLLLQRFLKEFTNRIYMLDLKCYLSH